MSSGLQRRRAAGASSAQDEDYGGSWSSTSPSSSSPQNGTSTSSLGVGVGHAGTAFEGGSKIAYDPRDLAQEDADAQAVGGRMPKLTIMEEILLLGIKDKQVCRGLVLFVGDLWLTALRFVSCVDALCCSDAVSHW